MEGKTESCGEKEREGDGDCGLGVGIITA